MDPKLNACNLNDILFFLHGSGNYEENYTDYVLTRPVLRLLVRDFFLYSKLFSCYLTEFDQSYFILEITRFIWKMNV